MLRWLLWLVLLPFSLPLLGARWVLSRFRPVKSLKLRLAGELLDASPSGPFSRSEGTALLPLLTTLSIAARDEQLEAVLIHMEEFSSGLGLAEELRAALLKVKVAGKRVVVHADELGLAGLWVATGATQIVVSPSGSVNVTGLGSEFTLLRGLFDKVGINPQLVARGKYKSMREMFTEQNISEANREMILGLLTDLSGQLAERVRQARGLSSEAFEALLAQAPFRADAALRGQLVDALQYWDELVVPQKKKSGERMLEQAAYLKMRQRRWLPRRSPKVALLRVGGNIKGGQDSAGPSGQRATGSSSFAKAVARAAEDSEVQAIVLRVNSPGGSALASDLMWRSLKLAQEKKPVFVSMANVAASGGYYVSGLKGARVWANPSTITGSIGVVGGKFSAPELLEKLGIQQVQIKLSPRANFYSASSAFDEEGLGKLEEDIAASYEEFVTKMAEGRGKSFEQLHEVAQGRVWTGSQALAHGLVDELGGLTDVLTSVRAHLGLRRHSRLALVEFNRQTILQTLKTRFAGEGALNSLLGELPVEASELVCRVRDFRGTRLLALLPFDLRFR